jgi:hypothetical protein
VVSATATRFGTNVSHCKTVGHPVCTSTIHLSQRYVYRTSMNPMAFRRSPLLSCSSFVLLSYILPCKMRHSTPHIRISEQELGLLISNARNLPLSPVAIYCPHEDGTLAEEPPSYQEVRLEAALVESGLLPPPSPTSLFPPRYTRHARPLRPLINSVPAAPTRSKAPFFHKKSLNRNFLRNIHFWLLSACLITAVIFGIFYITLHNSRRN